MPAHFLIRSFYFLFYSVILFVGFWILANQFVLIGIGFLLAFMLNPLVNNLERKNIPRLHGVIGSLILISILILAIYELINPIVKDQISYFILHQNLFLEKLTKITSEIKATLNNFISTDLVNKLFVGFQGELRSIKSEINESIPQYLGYIASTLSSFIFVPVVTFFLLNEGYDLKKRAMQIIPNRYFEMVMMIIHEANSKLGGYIRGQLMDSLIIGILAAIGLSIIDVKGAIAIGLFAGLANAIPYLGPVVGVVPAIAILLIDPNASFPWWSALIVFGIINLLDNTIVYPMTVGRSLNLHPLLVILSILFGGSVAGIPGMIVSVPLIAIIYNSFIVLHKSLKSYRII